MKMLEKVYKNEKIELFWCILDSLRPVRVLEKFQWYNFIFHYTVFSLKYAIPEGQKSSSTKNVQESHYVMISTIEQTFYTSTALVHGHIV